MHAACARTCPVTLAKHAPLMQNGTKVVRYDLYAVPTARNARGPTKHIETVCWGSTCTKEYLSILKDRF